MEAMVRLLQLVGAVLVFVLFLTVIATTWSLVALYDGWRARPWRKADGR